ncbi:MAG: SDR family oxidoreductase [Algiphilus sp.]|uniref:SDR family oxidoreductase n=1 Tax=Algiphilus sp. TaxID=1872431 RepID=UPI0032EFF6AD
MSNGLKDKVVAITGASSGIGEVTARHLAENGVHVLVGARRIDRLQKLVSALQAAGARAEYQALDVTDRASVTRFVDFAVERFGRLDALVNNAGVMPLSPLAALKLDEWDRMIDVNIKGVLNGIAAALPVFEDRGCGHVINTSSIAAYYVMPAGAIYCATKKAVNAITEGLRLEAPHIRTTIVSPGVTESELADTVTHAETAALVAAFRTEPMPADAIARAVGFAIAQPQSVDVSEIIVRPAGK